MKQWMRGAALAMMLALLVLTACGCGANFTLNPQELYSLPQLPAKYDALNQRLTEVTDGGAEYAAPTSGANIQAVQMVDLDNDGQDEALAFFRNTADEKPLKIYIFAATDGGYQQTAVIEGSGTGIYSIAYNDLDQDGSRELLVGWRVSADLQALAVYSLHGSQVTELVRTNYVRYAVTDLDQDGMQELMVLRADNENEGTAEYYRWQEGGLLAQSSTRLSITMAELSQQGRIVSGTLRDGTPALFVTGVAEGTDAITDILAERNGELSNIVLSDATGMSTVISRFHALYPTDINGDSLTEVPQSVPLPAWGADGEAAISYRIDWCTYGLDGTVERAVSTYHDVESGWYLQLPDDWTDRIRITRSTGADEASVSFSIWEDGTVPPVEFLRITTLTGSNREIKAARGSRFNLGRQSDTIYVAELLEPNHSWSHGVTEDELRSAFSLIRSEWLAGDN